MATVSECLVFQFEGLAELKVVKVSRPVVHRERRSTSVFHLVSLV